MSLATLDTHEVVKDLLTAGFSGAQAEAVARNLRKAQNVDLSSLATKPDLLALKSELMEEIGTVRGELRTEIGSVRGDLRIEIASVRGDLRTEIASVRGDIEKFRVAVAKDISDAKVDILKWMVGSMGFQTLIILGAVVTLIKLVKP